MSVDVFVILLMAVGVGVLVGEPLVRRTSYHLPPSKEGQEFEHLSLQKETLYTAIRDLDFDFQTSKIEQQDYAELRGSLEDEALQVLRQIDEIDPLAVLDHELERQIMALRQEQTANTCLPAYRTCSCCEATLHGGENFCPSCGQSLPPAS